MNIQEKYYQTSDRINSLKQQSDFDYKGIDLTDLLFNELMNASNSNRISIFDLIKNYIKFSFSNFRFQKNPSVRVEYSQPIMLIQVNTINQWNTVKDVVNNCTNDGYKVIILTGRTYLFKIIKHDNKVVYFVKGLKFSAIFNSKRSKFPNIIANLLPQVKYLYHHYSKLFKQYQVHTVLVGNDNTFEGRLLVRVAQKNNIPTACVQHGSMNKSNPIHNRSIVDKYFIYGNRVLQELSPLHSVNYIVSGNPKFDNFKNYTFQATKLFEKKYYLVALSGIGHSTTRSNQEQQMSIIAAFQREFDAHLIIKLHEKDRIENYSQLANPNTIFYTHNDLSEQQITLFDLINASQGVFTGASSIVFECYLLKKNVYTLNPGSIYKNIDFIEDRLTLNVTDYKELKSYILQQTNLYSEENITKIESYLYQLYNPNYKASHFIKSNLCNTLNNES